MAFHSRAGTDSKSARTNRRDRESILGLSGWLFADLLLAIAVVFLVAQEKPAKGDDEAVATTTTTVPAAEETGLIADRSGQLLIRVPGGARPDLSPRQFRAILDQNLQINFDETKRVVTSKELVAENYQFGFVIWFGDTPATSRRTYAQHFATFVQWMLDEGLISESQVDRSKLKDFPSLDQYGESNLEEDDLRMRVFLYKGLK